MCKKSLVVAKKYSIYNYYHSEITNILGFDYYSKLSIIHKVDKNVDKKSPTKTDISNYFTFKIRTSTYLGVSNHCYSSAYYYSS